MSKKSKKSLIEKAVARWVLSLRGQASTERGTRKVIKGFEGRVKRLGLLRAVREQLKIMYAYFIHPETSKLKKVLIGATLLYVIMPFDLIPDFIPFFGEMDDLAAVLFAWNILGDELAAFEEKYINPPEAEVVEDEPKHLPPAKK